METGKRTSRFGVALAGIAALVVLAIGAWFMWSMVSEDPEIQKWAGPSEFSEIDRAGPTSPADFATGSSVRLAVFLTRRDSSWLPLIHGLKAAGIPVRVVERVDEATRHASILVYPAITDRDLGASERSALRQHVDAGGLLIAPQVWSPDMAELFGFASSSESRRFAEVSFLGPAESLLRTNHSHERTVRIGNPEEESTLLQTQRFSGATDPWAVYEDGSTAVASGSTVQGGRALALGVDLGFWAAKAQANRDAGAQRVEMNGFDPSLDVWMRLIKAVYLDHQANSVALHTAPGGKELSVVLTVDVPADWAPDDVAQMSDRVRDAGFAATFFIQTRYRDPEAEREFFDPDRLDTLRGIQADGMSIASHSVMHPETLIGFPAGSGRERFPNYPGHAGAVEQGSLLGELRVSKHLLETATGGAVSAYRPGRVETPNGLPQLADAAGYSLLSSTAAADVMTYWPFRTTQNELGFVATDLFQFPIALSDLSEPLVPADLQSLVDNVAGFGGVLTVQLASPDRGVSSTILEELHLILADRAWIGGLNAFGEWWRARDQVGLDVRSVARGVEVSMVTEVPIADICIETPEEWSLLEGEESGWRAPRAGLYCTDLQPGRRSTVFSLK